MPRREISAAVETISEAVDVSEFANAVWSASEAHKRVEETEAETDAKTWVERLDDGSVEDTRTPEELEATSPADLRDVNDLLEREADLTRKGDGGDHRPPSRVGPPHSAARRHLQAAHFNWDRVGGRGFDTPTFPTTSKTGSTNDATGRRQLSVRHIFRRESPGSGADRRVCRGVSALVRQSGPRPQARIAARFGLGRRSLGSLVSI